MAADDVRSTPYQSGGGYTCHFSCPLCSQQIGRVLTRTRSSEELRLHAARREKTRAFRVRLATVGRAQYARAGRTCAVSTCRRAMIALGGLDGRRGGATACARAGTKGRRVRVVRRWGRPPSALLSQQCGASCAHNSEERRRRAFAGPVVPQMRRACGHLDARAGRRRG